MKLILTFIRSGKTENWAQGVFLGTSQDPLSQDGAKELEKAIILRKYPFNRHVFVSPVHRSIETARLIYPQTPHIIKTGLRAFDYGDFQGKSYSDVVNEPKFAIWAKADYLLACPNGEEPHEFNARCTVAMEGIVHYMEKYVVEACSIVCHRSVIESILKRFCVPREYYKDWSMPHGGGYIVEFDTDTLTAQLISSI